MRLSARTITEGQRGLSPAGFAIEYGGIVSIYNIMQRRTE
jgi:hypothetical protein